MADANKHMMFNFLNEMPSAKLRKFDPKKMTSIGVAVETPALEDGNPVKKVNDDSWSIVRNASDDPRNSSGIDDEGFDFFLSPLYVNIEDFENEQRYLRIYIDHAESMITFGYVRDIETDENGKNIFTDHLVWFSKSKISDIAFTEQILNNNRYCAFFRCADEDDVLKHFGIRRSDFDTMCCFEMHGISAAQTKVFGSFNFNVRWQYLDSEYLATFLYERYTDYRDTAQKMIGDPEIIYQELDKDLSFLNKLYGRTEEFNEDKYQQACRVVEKWQARGYLKLNIRANIRLFYRNICNHRAATRFGDDNTKN